MSKTGPLGPVFYAMNKNDTDFLPWIPFLLSPFFWPYLFRPQMGFDLLACACALFAAAILYIRFHSGSENHVCDWARYFIVLSLIILYHFVLIYLAPIKTASASWVFLVYLLAAYTIYYFGRCFAHGFFERDGLFYFFGLGLILYTLYALFQAFDLFLFEATLNKGLFHVWNKGLQNKLLGPFLQGNYQGLFALLAFVVFTSFLDFRQNRTGICFCFSCLALFSLFSSASRGSVLVLFLLIPLIVFLSEKRVKTAVFILVSGISSFLLYLGVLELMSIQWDAPSLPVHSSTLQGRMVMSQGLGSRFFVWLVSFHIGIDHWLWGIGFGNLDSHYAEYARKVLIEYPDLAAIAPNRLFGFSHNIFLTAWLGGGVLFLGATIIIFYMVLKKLFLFLKSGSGVSVSQYRAVLLLLTLLIHGLFSVALLAPFFLVIVALCSAVIFHKKPVQHV